MHATSGNAPSVTPADLQAHLHVQLAGVRSKEELLPVLQACVGQDALAISLCNDADSTITQYLHYFTHPHKKDSQYLELLTQPFPTTAAFFGGLLASTTAHLFQLDQPVSSAYLYAWQQLGMRQAMAVTLQVQGKVIGVLWVFSQELNSVEALPLVLVAFPVAALIKTLQAQEMIAQEQHENQRHRQQLQAENAYLQEQMNSGTAYKELIGNSEAMQLVYRKITMVANNDTTVLLAGETGTGKELIARAIHNASSRRDRLMIRVNCAALPEHLVESELFGHEKGSFTGATEQRIGKFELANNSTLFLDEIGEMPVGLQAKLLRAIQEREIERIGGTAPVSTDVRIIAATNRDLEKEISAGRFRSDLFYRLNVFPILLPPLRERKDDIPPLARHFLQKSAQAAGKKVHDLSAGVISDLLRYRWPGNVRELQHLMERSALLSEGLILEKVHLPVSERILKAARAGDLTSVKTIAEVERDHIMEVLEKCKGRIRGENGAAALLKIPPTTLHSKIKKLGIKKWHD